MIRFSFIVVFLLCMLNLVPPLYQKSMYFDNVYNVILYTLLSFLGISIPFIALKLNRYVRFLSSLIGTWYFAGLTFEILNFNFPDMVLNSPDNNYYYVKFLMCFTIGIAFIITSNTWIRQKR